MGEAENPGKLGPQLPGAARMAMILPEAGVHPGNVGLRRNVGRCRWRRNCLELPSFLGSPGRGLKHARHFRASFGYFISRDKPCARQLVLLLVSDFNDSVCGLNKSRFGI